MVSVQMQVSGTDIIFITALSGTGKTTTGDFLAEYCGVYHLDGDNILHHGVTDRLEWGQAAGDITKALFEHWLKGKSCPEELWHPYLIILIGQIKEALRHHNRIVVTWVVYRKEVREFLRQHLGPGLRFLRLDCETDVLVKGALARLEEGLKMGRMSIEEWWESEDPKMQNCGGRQRYGDFSFGSFKQMQLNNALNGMVDFGSDEKDAQVVDVSSRDAAALHRVSVALGLTPSAREIDIDKVKAINTARVKKHFAEMPAPSALSMARYARPRDAPTDKWEALLQREDQLEKALTVKPDEKRTGPSTQQLLEMCPAPRAFVRVRPLLDHEIENGARHLEGLVVRTSMALKFDGAETECGNTSTLDGTTPIWVQALEGSASYPAIGGFDGLFGIDADNRQVFAAAVEPVLASVMKGSGVSVFCYGHSGTGKTHSMLGYPEEPGIFTQTAHYLLEKISAINASIHDNNVTHVDGPLSLQVRFVELYLGKVYDLLDGRKECTMREDADGSLHIRAATDVRADGRVFVRNQHSVAVSSSDDLAAILSKGLEQRAVGTSSVNDQSSRSHALLEIEIVNPALLCAREAVLQAEANVHPVGKRVDELMVDLGLNGKLVDYCKGESGHRMIPKCDAENATMTMVQWFELHEQLVSEVLPAVEVAKKHKAELQQAKTLEQQISARGPPCLCSKVTLIDLAGNDFDKRNVSATHSMQQRKESNHINKDLLAVKECISGIALKNNKIPFRNSSLTRVLQKPLLPPNHEGATAIMLATVSPDAGAKVSTNNTLRYAQMLTGRTEEPNLWPRSASARTGKPKPWQNKPKTIPGPR